MVTTVKDLIAELQKYPENMKVVYQVYSSKIDGAYRHFDGVKEGLLNVNENFGLYTGVTEADIDELKLEFNLENPQFEKVLVIEHKD